MTEKHKVVILMAGTGQRLSNQIGPITKAMIEFEGVSLIEMNLRAFAECGIKEAVLAVGYFADKAIERIGSNYFGIKIRYVFNPLYAVTGSGYSLWLTCHFFRGQPCIIFDGDQLLHKRIIHELLLSPHENCIPADTDWAGPYSEELLVLGQDGLVEHLYWEPHDKPTGNIVGEAIGFIKLGARACETFVEELDSEVPPDYNGKLPLLLEYNPALDRMLRQHIMHYVLTGDLPWTEIDFPEDLDRARREVFPKIKETNGI